jgi:hypothetical protein
MESNESLIQNILIIISVAFVYFLISIANLFLFSSLSVAMGVTWIYLPSGVILLSVLIFGAYGAIGVAIASTIVTYFYCHVDSVFIACITGFISGFAAWIAKIFCLAQLNLDKNLQKITSKSLIETAAIFSLASAILRQLWFACVGQADILSIGTAIMAIGNFIGTVLVLYFAKVIIELVVRVKSKID